MRRGGRRGRGGGQRAHVVTWEGGEAEEEEEGGCWDGGGGAFMWDDGAVPTHGEGISRHLRFDSSFPHEAFLFAVPLLKLPKLEPLID